MNDLISRLSKTVAASRSKNHVRLTHETVAEIIGALEGVLPAASQPEAEPVAWQQRLASGGWGTILHGNEKPLVKARPLYTTPAPVVPAEGLDPERLVMAWMSEMEGFATRGERFMDTITDGNDVAPWLHAACQVGIDAALRAQQPAAPGGQRRQGDAADGR